MDNLPSIMLKEGWSPYIQKGEFKKKLFDLELE